jgi:hypothetical protein
MKPFPQYSRAKLATAIIATTAGLFGCNKAEVSAPIVAPAKATVTVA